MNIFITGASGYVGRAVVREMVRNGHTVTALLRRGSISRLDANISEKITIITGDVSHPEQHQESIGRADAIINLPGLIREFPGKGIRFEDVHVTGLKRLVDVAVSTKCRRFLQMSALGVRPDSVAEYQKTKFRAEEYLRASPLEWTIFRPSLIFGNEWEGGENFFIVLKQLLTMLPFAVPVLGNGRYRFQPISLTNIAQGFVKSLQVQGSIGKVYEIGGPDIYSYNELLDIAAAKLGIRKIKFIQPLILVRGIASVLDSYPFFPVTRDQIRMMEEGSVAPGWKEFFDELMITPIRLIDGLEYERQIQRNG